MKNEIRMSMKFCLLLFVGLFVANNLTAQQANQDQRDQQRTRKAQAVSKDVYDTIQQVQERIDAEDYDSALRLLQSAYHSDKLTDYERSNVLNYLGLVQYSMGNASTAIATFEEMLGIPGLEVRIRKRTFYTVAQLNMMQEQYTNALLFLGKWFALEQNPAAEPYILKAQVLYELGRHNDMIEPIETAMEIARNSSKPVKEDWYILLNFAYFQQADFGKVRDIQKTLLLNWPKKSYWFTLAGAFTELGEEENVLASYDLAHMQGLLDQESQLLTMAQLYMQHDLPYKAARMLVAQMETGNVSRSARNYRLLSQAWSLAREDEKAIPALIEAARLGNDGEVDLRLGNAYLNLGRYAECVIAVRSGLRKGDIRSPDNAQISLGMCLYNEQEYTAAKSAFGKAKEMPRSAGIADQWISVINSEIARNELIMHAEAAAQEQLEDLAKRRKSGDRS